MILLDGKWVAGQVKAEIQQTVATLQVAGLTPGLAVVLAGDDAASKVYKKRLLTMASSLGMADYSLELPAHISQQQLLEEFTRLNRNPFVHGILPLMPLPQHIDPQRVMDVLNPDKDVDCLSSGNIGHLTLGKTKRGPCTAMAVMEILRRYRIGLAGKHVVIIGRSNVVGKPLALLMVQEHATVTVCHSKTIALADITRQADVLVAAVGRPRMVTAEMVKPGAVVVDVGINVVEDTIVGDVDFDGVCALTSAITPVPGGVGSVSNVMVMNAVLQFAVNRAKNCQKCT